MARLFVAAAAGVLRVIRVERRVRLASGGFDTCRWRFETAGDRLRALGGRIACGPLSADKDGADGATFTFGPAFVGNDAITLQWAYHALGAAGVFHAQRRVSVLIGPHRTIRAALVAHCDRLPRIGRGGRRRRRCCNY